jgi:hypothetical protein
LAASTARQLCDREQLSRGPDPGFLLGGADPPIQGLVTTNVVFRYNYLTSRLAWRNAILAAPPNVTGPPHRAQVCCPRHHLQSGRTQAQLPEQQCGVGRVG